MRNIKDRLNVRSKQLIVKEEEINLVLLHYEENFNFEHKQLAYYNVIFLLKGKIEIRGFDNRRHVIQPNQFYLAGKNSVLRGSVEKNSEILALQFSHITSDPLKIKLQQLQKQIPEKRYSFRPLKASRPILLYIEQLFDLLDNKINCPLFAQSKTNELFLILEHFYTMDDFFTFSYPIITHATSFKDMILQLYLKTNTLKELQERTGMSVSTFNRKFKAEFNDSAYQWLLKHKANQIRMRLMNESTTLSDIIREFGFHSHSHLQKYCKTQFNMNPSELKKVLRSND